MNDAIEVEVNLMTSRNIKHKFEFERNKAKEESQPSSSHYSDARVDTMMKTMEKFMEVLATSDRSTV